MLRQKRPESNDPHDIADFVEARLDDMEQRLVGHMDAKFSEVRTLFYPDSQKAIPSCTASITRSRSS